MQVDIRRFQLSDYCQVKKIIETLTKTEKEVSYTFIDENYLPIVALNKNTIVGFASIFLLRKFFKQRPVGLIEDVVVNPYLQKRGIGQQLVEQLINYAKLSNCYKVILNCSQENQKFYEKLGFKQCEYQMRLDLT